MGPGRLAARPRRTGAAALPPVRHPWYAANRVVIYRKDLFEQAGITAPPRTRAEWLAATEKLNADGNQGIYLAGQDWYTLAGFIWDEGGDLATEDGGRWEGALDTRAALRGMDFYRRLQSLGGGPVAADEEHPPQAGVFAAGKVAQIVAVPGLARAVVQQNPPWTASWASSRCPARARTGPARSSPADPTSSSRATPTSDRAPSRWSPH